MFGQTHFLEILVVALVVLLLFGGKRLSGLGSAMGTFVRNFRAGLQDDLHPRD